MDSSSSKKKKMDVSPRLGQPSDAVSLQPATASSAATGNAVPAELVVPYRDVFSDDDASSLSFVAHSPQQARPGFDNDPPPLYTDDPTATAINPLLPSAHQTLPGGAHPPVPLRTDAAGNDTFLDSRLDSDPTYLEQTIRHLAMFPPRPSVRVRGTHTETHTSSEQRNGRTEHRTEHRTVVDFDVTVDLTPFLFRDDAGSAWRTLRTAGNFDKVRRGTVFETRAPGYGGSGARSDSDSEGGTPTLREWCHRYCASHSRLKTMLLRRRVIGFDEDEVRQKLVGLVRTQRYRGNLEVTFPTGWSSVEVVSNTWENRWRAVRWIRWLFYLTFLWIFSWPYLFFCTLRYEVVNVDWAFSRPRGSQTPEESSAPPPRFSRGVAREFATISEVAWYNLWARAIARAVLERRQGTLNQADLRGEEDATGSRPEGQPGQLSNILSSMNMIDRQFGWGSNC